MKSFYLFVFFFISTRVFSQITELDSLLKVLKTQGDDTKKVDHLNRISNIYYRMGDQINAVEYAKKGLSLSEKLNYTDGRLESYTSMNQGLAQLGNLPEQLRNLYKCLKLAQDSGKKFYVALALQFIGGVNNNMDNYDEALKYFFASLKIRKEMNDSGAIGQTYNSIGGVYLYTEKYKEALSYFTSALNIFQKLGDRGPYWGISWSFTNIMLAHLELGGNANKAGNKEEAMKEFSEALKYSLIALEIQKKEGFNTGIIQSYLQTGIIYTNLKQYSTARICFEKSLQLALSSGTPNNLPEIYFRLSETDSIRGDYRSAFQNYKMSVFYKDSLERNMREKETMKIQMQYEFDKKEIASKAEQEKKDAVTDAEISRQKVARNFSMVGAAGILVFGGFAFYNFRRRKKLEKERALADERLRISRDLHDDMGASLSSISVFSSAVKQKLNNNETHEAQQLLERMSTDAQEMVSGMSEMVWTISPHNDTVEKLTDRLQVYAAGMLMAKNISFQLECDEELKTKKLRMEVRKNVFLIFKEAINNAAKYSGATDVMLTISKKDNRFAAKLSDNGNGFYISSSGRGNGLKNMHQRADEIQSTIEIISEINKGTSVSFECPLPKIGEE